MNRSRARPLGSIRKVREYRYRLTVIEHFEAHGIGSTFDRFYPNLGGSRWETKRKSMYLRAKQKTKIQAACQLQATSELRRIRTSGSATTLSRDADLDLLKWINEY